MNKPNMHIQRKRIFQQIIAESKNKDACGKIYHHTHIYPKNRKRQDILHLRVYQHLVETHRSETNRQDAIHRSRIAVMFIKTLNKKSIDHPKNPKCSRNDKGKLLRECTCLPIDLHNQQRAKQNIHIADMRVGHLVVPQIRIYKVGCS